MRYSSTQSLRGYDKAAQGSITPTLSGVVVSDPRLPHEMKEESNVEEKLEAVVESVTVSGIAINQGDTVRLTNYTSSQVRVTGSNLSDENVIMSAISDGSHIDPTSIEDTLAVFVVPEENEVYALYVNGNIWATFIPEEPRP